MSDNSPSFSQIVSAALVLTGYMIGAGILALPVNLGPSGFLPAICGSIGVWFIMTCTGHIISRQPYLREHPDADMPSLFEAVLGKTGKWFSVAANLLILYGLLTAYLSGVASVAVDTLHIPAPDWVVLLVYFVIITLLTSLGDKVLHRGNAVLMVSMWGLFAFLLILVIPHFEGVDGGAADMGFFASGLPILVVAFNFHNVVPTICHTLNHDRSAIRKAIWLGSGIGFLMTLVWAVAVLLTLPVESASGVDILTAYANGDPATVPLAKLVHSRQFLRVALAFSVVAMSTSYMGAGTGLLNFFRDMTGGRVRHPWLGKAICFLPPLIISAVYPDGFLQALDVVGGLGIGTLFGLLPGVMLVKEVRPGSPLRILGWVIIAFFSFVLVVELGQQTGLLDIKPDSAYWALHSIHQGK